MHLPGYPGWLEGPSLDLGATTPQTLRSGGDYSPDPLPAYTGLPPGPCIFMAHWPLGHHSQVLEGLITSLQRTHQGEPNGPPPCIWLF